MLNSQIRKKNYSQFFLALSAILFSAIAVQAAPAKEVSTTTTTTHTIIKTDNLDNLASTTGLDDQSLQAIKNGLSSVVVKPEITTPADGGVVSGRNLLIKGISTPGSVVDILIEGAVQGFSPLVGQATSDKYGVWSYFLGPELVAGEYSVRALTKIANQDSVYSPKIDFIVPAVELDLSRNVETKDGFWEQPLLLIIAGIILSLTFLLSMLIWAIVYYLKGLPKKDIRSNRNWSTSDLANPEDLSPEQLEQVVTGFNKIYRLLSSRQSRSLPGQREVDNSNNKEKNKSNGSKAE